MSATENGPAPKESISHAAPTLCSKAPAPERTFAMSKCRKIGTRNGRHKVCDAGMDSTSPTATCRGNVAISQRSAKGNNRRSHNHEVEKPDEPRAKVAISRSEARAHRDAGTASVRCSG